MAPLVFATGMIGRLQRALKGYGSETQTESLSMLIPDLLPHREPTRGPAGADVLEPEPNILSIEPLWDQPGTGGFTFVLERTIPLDTSRPRLLP